MSIAQNILANPGKYSLEQLKQGVENGVIPAYIGVPIIQEMLQNQARMKGAGQEQMPPVMDQVMAQANQGLETLPSNLPQEYAGGGIIAFHNQGLVSSEDDARVSALGEAELKRMRDAEGSSIDRGAPSLQAYVDMYKNMLPAKDPRTTAYEESITKTPKFLDARKNQDLNMALAQFGLGLMGSKSRTFLGGVSEAAAPVLPSVQAALLARRTAEDTALKSQAEMAKADRAEGIAALTGGLGLHEKEEGRLSAEAIARLKLKESRAPTDQVNFVNNYVALQKQDPKNTKSDEALRQEGYDYHFKYGPRLPGATIQSAQSIAGGAQSVQTAGQENLAFNNANSQFNGLKMSDPIKQKYLDLATQDEKNSKAGIPSNLAEIYRADQINQMAARPTTPPVRVAPPAAPAAAVPSKVMTQADVAATAKARGVTTAEVAAAARLAGYTIR